MYHDLVRVAHAVFNNLRGDQPAKLGLTYAALREINPAVVCCSLSGFGITGPRAAEPAFDCLIPGLAGWMSITGESGQSAHEGRGLGRRLRGRVRRDGRPSWTGLWDAQRSGVGREIDVSLLDTAVSMLSYYAIWALNRDWQPRTRGGLRSSIARARAELPDARRLHRHLLQQAEVLGGAGGNIGLPEVKDAIRASRRSPSAWRTRTPCCPGTQPRASASSTTRGVARAADAAASRARRSTRWAQALDDEQVRAREMIIEVKHPATSAPFARWAPR